MISDDPDALTTDADGWIQNPNAKATYTVTFSKQSKKTEKSNLVSGKRYYVKAYGSNSAGKGFDSDTFSILAP